MTRCVDPPAHTRTFTRPLQAPSEASNLDIHSVSDEMLSPLLLCGSRAHAVFLAGRATRLNTRMHNSVSQATAHGGHAPSVIKVRDCLWLLRQQLQRSTTHQHPTSVHTRDRDTDVTEM